MVTEVDGFQADEAQHWLLDQRLNPSLESEKVNEKIGQVYLCTTIGFAASFISANLCALSGLTGKVVAVLCGASAFGSGIGLIAVGISLIAALHFTPKEFSGVKQGLYGLFTVYEGLVLSPLVLINAPVFAAASVVTLGVTGALGTLALKMDTQFKRYETIMFVALGVLTCASFAGLFVPAVASVLGHQLAIVGGCALFGAFVIYDMQNVRDAAEANLENFDVIDHTMNLYLDAMNLLVRIFELMNKRN